MQSDNSNTTHPDDIEQCARDFLRWVTHNNFADPEGMLICAEWSNLCRVLGVPTQMAGCAYGNLTHARKEGPADVKG